MTKTTDTSKVNEKWIDSTWRKLTKEIAYKTYNMDLPMSAADIAAKAITYAITPALEGKGEFPSSEEHLMRRARMVAKWEILKALQKASRSPECCSFDCVLEDEDGEPQEHSSAEVKSVMENYHADKRRNEMLAQGRLALRRLDDFLHRKGISRRDIEIYKARSLYQKPTDLVCSWYDISSSNLYKIVCVVNRILSRYGRVLVVD